MSTTRKKTLVVILSFALTDIVNKGELIARYFNPGDFFEEVHIVLTKDDRPLPESLQASVGKARLVLHNLPMPSLLLTLGWQISLLKGWLRNATDLIKAIDPSVIRSYGNFQSGYLATHVASKLGVRSVISLHTHPEDNRSKLSWIRKPLKRLNLELLRKFENPSLRKANVVIIVYESQRRYAVDSGAKDVRCIYNLVNTSEIGVKKNYSLASPPRILSVGRQFERKNPANIIRAIERLAVELTVVGDGPLHNQLISLASELGITSKVHFLAAVNNDELCRMMPNFDIFAAHWTTLGIPKSVIEPLLTGLPVVVNSDRSADVPEIAGGWVYQVQNSAEGYYEAFKSLLENSEERTRLGEQGRAYAHEMFDPSKIERQLVDLYSELL